MARNWVYGCCLFMMIIFCSQQICATQSSEIVLIVDRNPDYDHLSTRNYSISLQSGFSTDRYCQKISSEDDGTITSMCEFYDPLVFVKTDANGNQTTFLTSKIEFRGLPKINRPQTPPNKIRWDGRRPSKALIDKFFSQEAIMSRRERLYKKLQSAKLESRTLAGVCERKEGLSDMYL